MTANMKKWRIISAIAILLVAATVTFITLRNRGACGGNPTSISGTDEGRFVVYTIGTPIRVLGWVRGRLAMGLNREDGKNLLLFTGVELEVCDGEMAPTSKINDILEFDESIFAAGDPGGIFEFKEGKWYNWTNLTNPSGLPTYDVALNVTDILVSGYGILRRANISLWTDESSLINPDAARQIHRILFTGDPGNRTVVLCHVGDGVSIRRNGEWQHFTEDMSGAVPSNQCRDVELSGDLLWFGFDPGPNRADVPGLASYDLLTDQWQQFEIYRVVDVGIDMYSRPWGIGYMGSQYIDEEIQPFDNEPAFAIAFGNLGGHDSRSLYIGTQDGNLKWGRTPANIIISTPEATN